MDLHIGSPIFDRDSNRVGSLKHVIADPDTKQVAELVVGESGILGREVLAPIGSVNKAEKDRIELALDKDQMESLREFILTRYEAPPAELFTGSPWASGALIAQGMAPVGAAAGIESIAYTPIVDTVEQIPPGDIDLSPGTEVWATDGKLGSVQDVTVDDQTRRIRGLVVKKGFLFHEDVEISADQIGEITEDRVTLKIAKADLQPEAE